jgi:hypothetical protein
MKTFLTTLLALAVLFTNAEAQDTSLNNAPTVASEPITFEGWPNGTSLTTQYPNVTFNGAVILGPAALDLSDPITGQPWVPYPPHSGTNLIYDPNGTLTLTFSSPVNFVNGYFTYTNGVVMTAYNSSNTLLATAQAGASPSIPYNWVPAPSDPIHNPPPNQLIGITLATPSISSVVISSLDNSIPDSYVFADDISFTGSINLNPVPEPSSVILLGVVFLAGGYRYYGLRGIRALRRLHRPVS